MIANSNPFELQQLKSIYEREGETPLEKVGIYDSEEKLEEFIQRIPDKRVGVGMGDNGEIDKEI